MRSGLYPVTTTTSSTFAWTKASTTLWSTLDAPNGSPDLLRPMRDERPAARTIADVVGADLIGGGDSVPPAAHTSKVERTWISSAAMLIAISSGVSAPMESPMGACTRARSFLEKPSLSNASRVSATFFLLPIIPM